MSDMAPESAATTIAALKEKIEKLEEQIDDLTPGEDALDFDRDALVDLVNDRHDRLCARWSQPLFCCPDPLCRDAVKSLRIGTSGR